MVRFILLSHARSGSTVVMMSLADNPSVQMFGELFNDGETARRGALHVGRLYDRVPEPYREGDDAAGFLSEGVFLDRQVTPFAVGFKIFYDQARSDPGASAAWQYLIADETIRVIHLVRTNLLDSWVSLQIALLTNRWMRPTGSNEERPEIPPLNLDPRACEGYFDEVSAGQAWARRAFDEHACIEVEYERDLCQRFEATMHRIHDFLEVPRVPPTIPLEKQARRRAREQIANYDALGAHFRGSPYERFFT